MFAALALSLVFTFTYATWAAKSARAEKLLVPILDILQSVPILGLPLGHGGVLHVAGARAACWARNSRRSSRSSPARPGTWPSASISRCAPCRTNCSEAAGSFHLIAVDALLAARGAVRDAGADLEHDDVDVGRLVLRGRLRVRHASAIPTSRCPASAPISRWPSSRATLRAIGWAIAHHAHRDPAVRSADLPAAGGLGRSLPGRAGAGRPGCRSPGR